jgi:hypothetical protein
MPERLEPLRRLFAEVQDGLRQDLTIAEEMNTEAEQRIAELEEELEANKAIAVALTRKAHTG